MKKKKHLLCNLLVITEAATAIIFLCNAAQYLLASKTFLSSLNELNIAPVPEGGVGVCHSLLYIF